MTCEHLVRFVLHAIDICLNVPCTLGIEIFHRDQSWKDRGRASFRKMFVGSNMDEFVGGIEIVNGIIGLELKLIEDFIRVGLIEIFLTEMIDEFSNINLFQSDCKFRQIL